MESVTVNIPSKSEDHTQIDLRGLTDEELLEIIHHDKTYQIILEKLKESNPEDSSLPFNINDVFAELIQIIRRLPNDVNIYTSLSKLQKSIKKRLSEQRQQKDKKLSADKTAAEIDERNKDLFREDIEGYIKGICTLNNCIKKIKNFSPEKPDYACPNYNPDDCLTELDVVDLPVNFYNEIHWPTLFKNKMFYFNTFNEYLNRYLIQRLTGTFQYLYNTDYDDIGVFAKLITENDHPCKDINVVFQTVCRKGSRIAQEGIMFSIFHIALHSKESKKYTPPIVSREKNRNQLACGYYSRAEITSGVIFGAFHYKIDNYTGFDTLTKTKCEGILGDKSPFKKLTFDSADSKKFLLNYNDFQFHDEEIKSDLDKSNKFLIFNMFHNCIYNLFIYYLNEFILPTISNNTYSNYDIQSEKNYSDYCIGKGGFDFLISKLSDQHLYTETKLKLFTEMISPRSPVIDPLNGGKLITRLKKNRKGSKGYKGSKLRRNISIRRNQFRKKISKKNSTIKYFNNYL
jgi:hypothetical protein